MIKSLWLQALLLNRASFIETSIGAVRWPFLESLLRIAILVGNSRHPLAGMRMIWLLQNYLLAIVAHVVTANPLCLIELVMALIKLSPTDIAAVIIASYVSKVSLPGLGTTVVVIHDDGSVVNLAAVTILRLTGADVVLFIVAKATSCLTAIELFRGLIGSALGLSGSIDS